MKSYKINENTDLKFYDEKQANNLIRLSERKGIMVSYVDFARHDLLPLTKALIQNMDKRDLLNLNEAIQEIILDGK
jgi:hypothetical protein